MIEKMPAIIGLLAFAREINRARKPNEQGKILRLAA
jgi:hypothetical protein